MMFIYSEPKHKEGYSISNLMLPIINVAMFTKFLSVTTAPEVSTRNIFYIFSADIFFLFNYADYERFLLILLTMTM